MQMTLDEFVSRFPDRRSPMPGEFAGQWVAWNQNCTEILSHGKVLTTVREQAMALGCERPVLQKVPHAPFVGRT